MFHANCYDILSMHIYHALNHYAKNTYLLNTNTNLCFKFRMLTVPSDYMWLFGLFQVDSMVPGLLCAFVSLSEVTQKDIG